MCPGPPTQHNLKLEVPLGGRRWGAAAGCRQLQVVTGGSPTIRVVAQRMAQAAAAIILMLAVHSIRLAVVPALVSAVSAPPLPLVPALAITGFLKCHWQAPARTALHRVA